MNEHNHILVVKQWLSGSGTCQLTELQQVVHVLEGSRITNTVPIYTTHFHGHLEFHNTRMSEFE